MIESTKALVLHQIRYSDSGIVVQFFTRKYGRLSCLIKGMRKKKSGKQNVFFQPMFLLDVAIYYKNTRELQTIKDFSPYYSPADIYSNIKKSSVAVFLSEVLTSVLREESPNEHLYDFLENSIVYFDSCKKGFANFHLVFLAILSAYLGFEPGRGIIGGKNYFDLLNGRFVPVPPVHGKYVNQEISEILATLFSSSSYETIHEIILTGALRNEVLEILVKYLSLHLPGLKKIKSLEVLKEVFI